MTRAGWVRIIPFALFMGFIGIEQGIGWLLERGSLDLPAPSLLYLYPLKALLVAAMLGWFWRDYVEISLADFKQVVFTGGSVLLGLLVFVLWIHMDWDFATFGQSSGFNPYLLEDDSQRLVIIASRLFGAVLVVPVMEELFWRSFLLRYTINADFMKVRIGTYSLGSLLICAVLFGLEHHLVLAGIMAGLAYSGLLYWTRSIAQCILAHAVTNLALGIYVLNTGAWQFW